MPLLGNDLALKHMVGADPIMGRTFRTPWWDPTYDAGHSWAPHPEPGGEVSQIAKTHRITCLFISCLGVM